MWMVGDKHSLIRVVAGIVAGHFSRFQDGNEWEWTISISRWFDGSFCFFLGGRTLKPHWWLQEIAWNQVGLKSLQLFHPSHFRCFSHRFHWFSPLIFPYFLKKPMFFLSFSHILPTCPLWCSHIFLWLSNISPIFWHSCPMISHSFPMIFHRSSDQRYGFLVVPLFFHMLTCYFPIFPYFPIVFHSCSTDLPIKTSISRGFLLSPCYDRLGKEAHQDHVHHSLGRLLRWESIGKIRKTDTN